MQRGLSLLQCQALRAAQFARWRALLACVSEAAGPARVRGERRTGMGHGPGWGGEGQFCGEGMGGGGDPERSAWWATTQQDGGEGSDDSKVEEERWRSTSEFEHDGERGETVDPKWRGRPSKRFPGCRGSRRWPERWGGVYRGKKRRNGSASMVMDAAARNAADAREEGVGGRTPNVGG